MPYSNLLLVSKFPQEAAMTDLDTATSADGAIEIIFLRQVGDDPHHPDPQRDAQVSAVAGRLAALIRDAHSTLDLAVYDFRLEGAPAEQLISALSDRARAGVAIRIAYDPTSASVPDEDGANPTTLGAAPKSATNPGFLARLNEIAETKPISGYRALMHNKYIIRDGLAADAVVLTGSTNFTNDAWGLQENNLVILRSQDLSSYYATDFQELWGRGKITESTGYRDTGTAQVGSTPVTVAFTPGESATLVRDVVNAIEIARERLIIAAMVMSSGPILAAISEAMDRSVEVVGLCDGPQMDTVLRQWTEANVAADKISMWKKVAGRLGRKESIPYAPDVPHNFMHDKLLVADAWVVSGSFNFSNHARDNAENSIILRDPKIAQACEAYIRGLVARYSRQRTP
jgi:phosphatidylserine/phosphatidylglycerophosphate/cardiolipin synthase-like enzyme